MVLQLGVYYLANFFYVLDKNLSTKEIHVCVKEQHYVSIFFTHLWSIGTALILDTQNPEITGFSTMHAYKPKRQAKMKQRQKKMFFFLLASQQSI